MDKKKILVVEDNIITAKHISNSIKKFGYEVTDMANSVDTVIKSIIKDTPDLVILDINLGQEVDGIQIADLLEKEYGIAFIFLTSYNDEQTINRILKLNPLGYIIKPFNPPDLKAVIDLALYKIKSSSKAGATTDQKEDINAQSDLLSDYLFVKNGRNIDRIQIKDIDFVQADGRYTYIHSNGTKKISNTPLKTLLEKLEHSRFIRTHKSFLVNLTKVDTITLNYLVIGDYDIPISKNYRSDLLAGLDIV